jgi:hypothetical protein
MTVRSLAALLLSSLIAGCSSDPGPRTLDIESLRGLHADLYYGQDRLDDTLVLVLTLVLPQVAHPSGPEDCPMLDQTIRFTLGDEPPVHYSPGYYVVIDKEWSGPTKTCGQTAEVTFNAPLAGGRVKLAAVSPDGEASVMVDLPPAYQPTIVDAQPSYRPGGVITLQPPPEFLTDVGITTLPVQDMGTFCFGPPLCFEALLYPQGGVQEQYTDIGSDGATLSVYVPTTTGVYDVYVDYRFDSARPLAVDECVGYRGCSGLTTGGTFAPVTVDVRW